MNMKTKTLLFALSALVLFAGCSKEAAVVEGPSKSSKSTAKTYKIEAGVGEFASTKAYFKDDEAPQRWIYWEADDEFDLQDIMLGDSTETVGVTSSVPTDLSTDAKSAFFEATVHDYLVVSYPKGAVTLSSSAPSFWNSTIKDTSRFDANQAVYAAVTVPAEQTLSSTLTPDLIPMASKRIALSDAAVAAVQSGKDTVSVVGEEGPVKVYPLAALVRIHVKGLEGVESGKINRVNFVTEYASKSSSGLPEYGITGTTYFTLADTIALGRTHDGNSGPSYRNYVNLSGGTVDYTAEGGADVCFVVNHSSAKANKFALKVYLEDGAVFSKSFDLQKDTVRFLGFSKSRVTSLTFDFDGATQVKAASNRFNVEWSSGFLTYDADNQAYKFAGKDDIGLYFKFGSAAGVAFYKDTQDWDYRLSPSDATTDVSIQGGKSHAYYTPDGQTQSNGSCYYYVIAPSAGQNCHWIERKYYYPNSDGKIVEGTLPTVVDYLEGENVQGSTAFADATDPCSYVPVGEGENKWRMPTEADLKSLVEVGGAGFIWGNTDGSAIGSNDGKSRYLRMQDGEQDITFKATGSVDMSASRTSTTEGAEEPYGVKIQQLFGNKYAVRFWTSTYKSSKGTAFDFKVSSSIGIDTGFWNKNSSAWKVPTASKNAGAANRYVASHKIWDAANVRCVRDKK